MKKLTAAETLNYLIALFLEYLETLSEADETANAQFVAGEKLAYVECLEIIQYWEHACKNGLDFDIEKRFPL